MAIKMFATARSSARPRLFGVSQKTNYSTQPAQCYQSKPEESGPLKEKKKTIVWHPRVEFSGKLIPVYKVRWDDWYSEPYTQNWVGSTRD